MNVILDASWRTLPAGACHLLVVPGKMGIQGRKAAAVAGLFKPERDPGESQTVLTPG